MIPDDQQFLAQIMKHMAQKQFTVFTGHEDPAKENSELDWAQLAAAPGTKIVLMGAERIGHIAEALRANGMAADTPVVVDLPDQGARIPGLLGDHPVIGGRRADGTTITADVPEPIQPPEDVDLNDEVPVFVPEAPPPPHHQES